MQREEVKDHEESVLVRGYEKEGRKKAEWKWSMKKSLYLRLYLVLAQQKYKSPDQDSLEFVVRLVLDLISLEELDQVAQQLIMPPECKEHYLIEYVLGLVLFLLLDLLQSKTKVFVGVSLSLERRKEQDQWAR